MSESQEETLFVEDSADDISIELDDFDFNIDGNDLLLIGDSLLDIKGPISHHLESANNFYKNGIKQIITEGFKTEKELVNRRDVTDEDKEIERIFCKVIYTDVHIRPPTTLHYKTGKDHVLYPKVALAREKIYSGTLLISCEIKATAYFKNGTTLERSDIVPPFKICTIPIIKGSIMCNTYGKSKEELIQMGEDPSDPGGYFLVKGEWAVDCTENMVFNQPKIYINEGYGKSRLRCEFMSKPGDTYQNSDFIIIRYHTDDTITIEIARNEVNEVQIPFYLLFRAMGWSSDKDLLDWIVYDYDSPANKAILNNIMAAMHAKYNKTQYKDIYNQMDALKLIVDMIPEENMYYFDLKNKPENYHNAITHILKLFDTHCLPHIGMTPAARHEKLKFIALLIRKALMVYLRYIPPTDRDSYRSKRIHAAGDNYAKTVKTYFNQAVRLPILRRIVKDFNSAPFSQVNLVNMIKSAIFADDFERLIVQTITSGNKATLKIKKKQIMNRLATQQLHRKNQLNVLATMRQVTSTSADSAKQSERASEMRRVHMSSVGFICVAHSPTEGEHVGINKQLTMFTTIAAASSSEVLKKIIINDSSLIPENKLTPHEIYNGNYARVFINGYLMGYVKDSIIMINKYRQLRRNLKINPYTTIYWDNTQNEIQFLVDNGRLTRPLIIVYNTKRDAAVFKGSKTNGKTTSLTNDSDTFKQGIGITQKDIKLLYEKKKTIDDLLYEKKIEYITPEEQENCFLCASFEQLKKDSDNELKEYTHCDIPQAMLGITALTAPYANHNQCPRVTYQTAQAKQTCGYFSLNWPYRMDKETFLQYVNETPLIKTIANKYLFPNGTNIMVAMVNYTGFGQEDGVVINKAAIERGLFDGSKFTYYKTEFEQKEELGNPDASKTDGLKSANYEKLVNGVVQRGTLINNEDVLIGKYMPIPKGKDEKYVYMDRSIVYKENEPAIVHNVIVDRNNDGEMFVKCSLRKIRPMSVGDKMCLRPSAEVLTDKGWISLQDLNITDTKVATMHPVTHKLDYVNPTQKYEFNYDSNIDGKLYSLETQRIHTVCTPNHKNYIKQRDKNTFIFQEAQECFGKRVNYKRNCTNVFKEAVYIKLKDEHGTSHRYKMNAYLKLLGMFISDGLINKNNIWLCMYKQRKRDYIRALESDLGFTFNYTQDRLVSVGKTTAPGIYEEFKKLSVGALNKYLPYYVWLLGNNNCRELLDGLINGDGSVNASGAVCYYTSSKKLANDVQRLVFHAGYSSNIRVRQLEGDQIVIKGVQTQFNADGLCVRINMSHHEPQSHHGHYQACHDEKWIDYQGKVMCIKVPKTHLFYYRENMYSPPLWTGNSSRSG